MHFLRCTLCFFLLSAAGLSNMACAQEVVHLYMIEEFDRQGNQVPIGSSDATVLRYLEANLGLQFVVHHMPWKRAMESTLNSDGVLMGMSITKERQKKFAFSDPITANANFLVTRCDAMFKFNTLQDLKGKFIGVIPDTSSGEAFDQQANVLFNIENDTGAGIARLQKLALRRTDALVWYSASSSPKELGEIVTRILDPIAAAKPDNPNRLCALPKPVSVVTHHFTMKIDPNKNQLLQRINTAMAKGRQEGVLPAFSIPR